jgi:hypothetical protein
MNEQEITHLLESLRQRRPQPADPRLRGAVDGYRRWGRAMRRLRTLAACVALLVLTTLTSAFMPGPRYEYVKGAAKATVACRQVDTILAKS